MVDRNKPQEKIKNTIKEKMNFLKPHALIPD
jgi:hypothetical protein